MDFQFLDPGQLIDGDLELKLIQTEVDESGEEPLPTYRFQMEQTGEPDPVGFINLRLGSGPNLVLYRGHIGYGVERPFRGNRYAERSCRLLLPLARRHG